MIRIFTGSSVNLDGEHSIFIEFPYNATLVAKVKEMPTRRYYAEAKCWELPTYDIKKVLEAFNGYDIDIDETVDLEAERPMTEYERMVAEGGNSAMFAEELSLIKTDELREFARDLLDRVPKYFFVVPASSSGKYHPSYALGEGGLVRHTKAAMLIANELLQNDTLANGLRDDEKDVVLVALLFHDSLKHGKTDDGGHTIFSHPIVATEWIAERYQAGETTELDSGYVDMILDCIETHMGQWNKPYGGAGKEELPTPKTRLQKITHLADYLASRKFLEVVFN